MVPVSIIQVTFRNVVTQGPSDSLFIILLMLKRCGQMRESSARRPSRLANAKECGNYQRCPVVTSYPHLLAVLTGIQKDPSYIAG